MARNRPCRTFKHWPALQHGVVITPRVSPGARLARGESVVIEEWWLLTALSNEGLPRGWFRQAVKWLRMLNVTQNKDPDQSIGHHRWSQVCGSHRAAAVQRMRHPSVLRQ